MQLIVLLMSALAGSLFTACASQKESPAVVLNFPPEMRKFAVATDNDLRTRWLDGSPKPPVNRILDPRVRPPSRFSSKLKISKSTIQQSEVGNAAQADRYSTAILVGTQTIVFLVDTESANMVVRSNASEYWQKTEFNSATFGAFAPEL